MKKKGLSLLLVLILALTSFLTGCGGGDTSASGTGEADKVSTDEVITWKVQSNSNPNTEFAKGYDRLLDNIELMSGGRLVIEHYYSGTLVPLSEATNAVTDGTLNAMLGYGAQWSSLEYAQSLFCSIPAWFSDGRDFAMWMKNYGGEDLMNESLAEYNVIGFMMSVMDMDIFQWSNKKIETIDDIMSTKMRMMPLMGDVLQAHGAPVAFIAGNELFAAMERGVVDGVEWSYAANDLTEGYHEIAKYYTYPGVHQPTGSQELYINLDSWNALPADLQEVIKLACNESVLWIWNYAGQKNIEALAEFDKNGNEMVRLDEETIDTLMTWANDYMDEKASTDEYLAKLRKSMIDFGKVWFPYKEFISMPYPDLSKY